MQIICRRTITSEIVQIPPVLIEDIDDAIFSWTRALQIKASGNDQQDREVPVFFFPKERWQYALEGKGLRDQNGTLILPAIAVRRTNIDRTPGLWAPGVDTQYIEIDRRLDDKTYGRTGRPVYRITSVPFPSLVAVDYEIRFWANYISQANHMLEQLFNSLRWRQEIVATSTKGTRFVGLVDYGSTDASNIEEFTDEKRIFIFNTSVRMVGYLHTDTNAKVDYSIAEIKIDREVCTKNSCFSEKRTSFDDQLDLYRKLHRR